MLVVFSSWQDSSLRIKDVQGPVNDMTLPDFEITVTGPYVSATCRLQRGRHSFWHLHGVRGELSEEWNVTEVSIPNAYISEVELTYGAVTVAKVVSQYEALEYASKKPSGFSRASLNRGGDKSCVQ